ncbi:MAG: hypothetical protein OXS30_09140 [Chloroflexota bacterium]|nr:hypothetical protein [Chloroflexota bacterium]
MPLYLSEARWDTAQSLDEVLEALEDMIQRTGGQLLQALHVDNGLSLTIETPDDLSLFRIAREASALGLELTSRVALSRTEAEALDRAHRERSN